MAPSVGNLQKAKPLFLIKNVSKVVSTFITDLFFSLNCIILDIILPNNNNVYYSAPS